LAGEAAYGKTHGKSRHFAHAHNIGLVKATLEVTYDRGGATGSEV